ncbi:MAG: hypothetical protein R2695_05615 [Acidimicrobiales bacterium]
MTRIEAVLADAVRDRIVHMVHGSMRIRTGLARRRPERSRVLGRADDVGARLPAASVAAAVTLACGWRWRGAGGSSSTRRRR